MKKGVKLALVGALSIGLLAACNGKDDDKKVDKPKQEVTVDTKKGEDSYEKYAKQIADVKKTVDKYQDVNEAVKDGFLPASPYVPGMGFHFVKGGGETLTDDSNLGDPTKPNTLLYALDENKKLVLAGAEWAVLGKNTKHPKIFDGIEWKESAPAGGHYEDGTVVPAETEALTPKTNPQTGAKLIAWKPPLYAVHMYTHIKNPDGVFAEYNKTLTQQYDKNAKGVIAPPVKIPPVTK